MVHKIHSGKRLAWRMQGACCIFIAIRGISCQCLVASGIFAVFLAMNFLFTDSGSIIQYYSVPQAPGKKRNTINQHFKNLVEHVCFFLNNQSKENGAGRLEPLLSAVGRFLSYTIWLKGGEPWRWHRQTLENSNSLALNSDFFVCP